LKHKLSIVAPAFNEEDCIEAVVGEWVAYGNTLHHDFEIIIVNDGSTDRTGEILKKLTTRHPELIVLGGTTNAGYGAALIKAIQASSGDWILTIDSDGQFCVSDHARLLGALQRTGAECAVGIRNKNDTFIRKTADKCLRTIGRIIFGVSYQDPNCALKLCAGNILRSMTLESRGFSSPSEILYKLDAMGVPLSEVSVQHLERKTGISKLKFLDAAISIILFFIYLRIKISLQRKNILYLNSPTDNARKTQPTLIMERESSCQ